MFDRLIGRLFPGRGDSDLSGESVSRQSGRVEWGSSIHVPLARDRMLEHFEREQFPGDVKHTLAAALNGDLHYQQLLFNAMLDTWPRLQKGVNEMARMVCVAPWKVQPHVARGAKALPQDASECASEIEQMIWRMRPDTRRGETGLEGTIQSLVRGYFYGHQVLEIRWEQGAAGEWRPRCTKTVPARYYGYPYDVAGVDDPEDRLMFDPQGSMGARQMVDFPEHRFLIAVNKGHEGHAAAAAPLRALAAYWLAAVYGLRWFMSFTQLYGIPWRHAELGSNDDENVVNKALASIGANGFITTRAGTKINVMQSPNHSGNIPQHILLDLADRQCDHFILGQTLTSGTEGGGSRALGEVHEKTRDAVVDGIADFVGGVLSYQLIPSIVALNWGDAVSSPPEMWAKREAPRDERLLAERDVSLGITTGDVAVPRAWFYERHGIPIPGEGEELLMVRGEVDLSDGKGGESFSDADESESGSTAASYEKPSVLSDEALAALEEMTVLALEGVTGLSSKALAPVLPAMRRLAALVVADLADEADFTHALEQAREILPKVFSHMDAATLEKGFRQNRLG